MPKHFNFDNTPKEPGIYKIYNMKNKKCYVGSSVNLRKRWGEHLWMLRGNYHFNQHLQRAWNKYGEAEFEFIVLERVEEEEYLVEREQLWINLLNSYEEGYNILPHAGNSLGYTHTEETRRKISMAHRGKHCSKETRQKISEAMRGEKSPIYGKHLPKETRQKISEAMRGKKHSDETKRKMSESHRGENNWFYGKHHSKEARKKMSEALTGRELSKEHRNHISEALTGRELSEETREKMSEAHQGKHRSGETRQKISESEKKTYRNKLRDYDKKRGQLLLFPKIYSTF